MDSSDDTNHPALALALVEAAGQATLATLDPTGHPSASLVAVALVAGRPVLLISRLAAHTQNLAGDARCSLLFREEGDGEALALGRVTLQGLARPVEEPATVRQAFLARHPEARTYVDFPDFRFFAVQVERVRYVGGFGRMSWIDEERWEAVTG